MNKKQLSKGFTVIEVVVTMTIVAALMSASILTLRGYMPKQRLLSATDSVEKALSQAQYEATSRVFWTCVNWDQGANILNVYVDQNGDRICNNANDFIVGSHSLERKISFSDCTASSGDGNPFALTDFHVWFDTSGAPNLCSDPSNCDVENLEFIVTSSDLPSGNRAREVEASSSGLIEIVARGETGYNTFTHAKTTTGTTSNGCE